MTRVEKQILRASIKAVAHHNPHAWWELKRQIYDGGYQPYYPMQGDFQFDAERAVKLLTANSKEKLLEEWRKTNPGTSVTSFEDLVSHYAAVIIEEVVERANVAAYRTTNW